VCRGNWSFISQDQATMDQTNVGSWLKGKPKLTGLNQTFYLNTVLKEGWVLDLKRRIQPWPKLAAVYWKSELKSWGSRNYATCRQRHSAREWRFCREIQRWETRQPKNE
jgi:hypothetical protein